MRGASGDLIGDGDADDDDASSLLGDDDDDDDVPGCGDDLL